MTNNLNIFIGLIAALVLAGCAMSGPQQDLAQKSDSGDLGNGTPIRQISHTSQSQETITTLGPNDNLSEIIAKAKGNVIIDFYADWCGPCKRQSKVLAGLEHTALTHDASIVKINVDQYPELAREFKVVSLPTLILVKDKTIVDRSMGLTSSKRVSELLLR